MKKSEPFSHPEGFFEVQEKNILIRTTGEDAWRLPGLKRPEDAHLLPDGFWLQMEEGIRNRIRKPQKATSFVAGFSWKPVLASLTLLLCIGLAWKYFRQDAGQNQIAESQLNQLNQQEILFYLTENAEAREISEQLALQQIQASQLEIIPEVPVSDEELLENLDETDFANNL